MPATETEVAEIVRKAPAKHCILDIVPTWLMKETASEFTPVLTCIINASLASGEVPLKFKEAVINPLLKKPSLDRNEINNYRPVSNLNFMGKVLEKIVASRIQHHLNSHQLLEPFQSAYRRFHSTETALTRVFNDLAMALDQGKVAVLVLLDLSAAFDTVDHSILLERCRNDFGICGIALRWLESYLSDRTQCVAINNQLSSPRTLKCGVPQGSILGPLLFIMYTSPLGKVIRENSIHYHLYADDTQLYAISELEDLGDTISHTERAISKVKDWMNANLLKLNTNKTEFLVITNKYQLERVKTTTLKVADDAIQASSSARNIGVIFDSSLSMIPHINIMTSSLNYHLRNISRIRNCLTRNATETLVHALISSRLDYANNLLSNIPACRLKPLQRAQNSAARIVTYTPRSAHITPVLKSLHWLPVEARIIYKTAALTFKALNGLAPVYLSELISKYLPSRDLRSSDQSLLTVRSFNTQKYGRRAFSVSAPILWNSLPEDVRSARNYELFKKKLKTFLFNRSYS